MQSVAGEALDPEGTNGGRSGGTYLVTIMTMVAWHGGMHVDQLVVEHVSVEPVVVPDLLDVWIFKEFPEMR